MTTVNGNGTITDGLPPRELNRRTLLKWAFLGSLAAMSGIAAKSVADYVGSLNISRTGAITVGHVSRFPAGMHPVHFKTPYNRGGFWVVHIIPEYGGEGKFEGLLALKDTIGWNPAQWRQGLMFGEQSGWFRGGYYCSLFTYAGGRVFGPAPRNLDTYEIEINKFGNVVVHTRRVTTGGDTPDENAARAVTF